MRISDWSSDVCSSDLPHFGDDAVRPGMAGNSAAEERELQWNLLIHPRIALRQFPQRGNIAGLSHKGEAAAFLQFIENGGKRRRRSIARTRRRDNLIEIGRAHV